MVNRRRWASAAVGFLLLAGGNLTGCAGSDSSHGASTGTEKSTPHETPNERLVPPDARKITHPKHEAAQLVIFTDYQCPFCAKAHGWITQAAKDFGDKVGIYPRNFPLVSMHKHAQIAAQAVEAAAEQDALEPMAGLVYEHQADWKDQPKGQEDIFAGYAQQLSLNVEKFRGDLTAAKTRERIQRDRRDGEALGFVDGTPTLVLNGKKIDLPREGYPGLKRMLEKALSQQ